MMACSSGADKSVGGWHSRLRTEMRSCAPEKTFSFRLVSLMMRRRPVSASRLRVTSDVFASTSITRSSTSRRKTRPQRVHWAFALGRYCNEVTKGESSSYRTGRSAQRHAMLSPWDTQRRYGLHCSRRQDGPARIQLDVGGGKVKFGTSALRNQIGRRLRRAAQSQWRNTYVPYTSTADEG